MGVCNVEMNYEIRTEKSFDEATKSIKEQLEKCKFGVLWELDFREKLAEKGFELDRDIKILEVCNPEKAKNVLEKNIGAAYFLPCKIVIYGKGDGIYIGMVRPEKIIDLLGDENLYAIAKDIESELKRAIQDASR